MDKTLLEKRHQTVRAALGSDAITKDDEAFFLKCRQELLGLGIVLAPAPVSPYDLPTRSSSMHEQLSLVFKLSPNLKYVVPKSP
jgi:hypothetical protein